MLNQANNRRRIQTWLVILISATCIWYFHTPILTQLARWLDVGETPRAADYVMVLPGGPDRRPFVAAAMVKRGLAKGVLTAETETNPANDEGIYPTSGEVLRRTLELRGVDRDQVRVLPGKSESTWTDSLALAQYMKEDTTATIAIVTDGYHTRRSRWVFQRVLGTDSNRVFFVSAPLDTVFVDSWWTTEEGLVQYVGEYFKLALYLGTDRSMIGPALMALVTIMLWKRFRGRRA